MPSGRVPALEIGGTHVTAALVETESWRVADGTMVRLALDADGTADEVIATVADAAAALRPPDGAAWGVAIPGPFDYARGVASFRGVGKFDALRGLDVGAALRRRLPEGTAGLHFLNDAEAFAAGEWLAGAARGHRRTIAVTLGSGVGSAFLVDGRARHRGGGVPPYARIDLLEIAGRPLEETVSRRAIRSRYAVLTGANTVDATLDVRDIAARARSGDPDAALALAAAMSALGTVLAPLATDFRASILVVGGSISRAWDVIEAPLRSGMDEASPGWSGALTVAPAQHLDQAALLGAARHAAECQAAALDVP